MFINENNTEFRLQTRWALAALLAIPTLVTAGCGSRSAVYIEAVLAADRLTTTQGGAATEIVGRMRAIDTQRCPKEFQAAYLTHIHAWERAAEVQKAIAAYEQQNGTAGVMMESFVRGLLGDPFGKFNELSTTAQNLNSRSQQAQTEIRDTFHRVEEVATQYGARLKPR